MSDKLYECWDDTEEAPELGDGEYVRAESAEFAARAFAEDRNHDNGDRTRVCVREDGRVRCFEVTLVREVDVVEKEYAA